MKKVKKVLSCLTLAGIMALTTAPASSVYADTSGGPQGGSNSGSTQSQTQQEADALLQFLLWLIMILLGGG